MSASSRIGMPANLYLNDFGQLLLDSYGEMAYWVGSSAVKASWRDVDVRMILDDDRYAKDGYGDPANSHSNPKWVAEAKVWSAYGKSMTGLPIDFQVQQMSWANREYPKPEHVRCPIFNVRSK